MSATGASLSANAIGTTQTPSGEHGYGPAASTSSPHRNSRRLSQLSHKLQDVAINAEEMPPPRAADANASAPNMFKKLRQNSKHIFTAGPSKRAADDSANLPDLNYFKVGQGKLSFFDLPAEIRNAIYEDVAHGTRLYVCSLSSAARKKEKDAQQTTPALLLTSKQTRVEYLPLLLECASISFAVRDFDFRNIVRVSGGLYASELKALRKNPSLTVRLLATKPSKDSLAALRRWAQRRTEDLYTFPVQYALVWPKVTKLVPTSTNVQRINTYIQRRMVLYQNLQGLSALSKDVPEALQWELQPVVELFEREMEEFGAMGGNARNGRALDPYGDQWLMPMFGRRF